MPRSVDRKIQKLRSAGYTLAAAIRILKSRGAIKQRGGHLVDAGRKQKGHRKG